MHKKHSLPPCAGIAALALLLLTDASAHADPIWGYNWSPSTTQVNSIASSGPGYLTLTNEPGGSTTGSSNTVITNIQAFSTATSSTPAVFDSTSTVSFGLQLKDTVSDATDNLKFSGYFSGTLTADSTNIQLKFTSPTSETVTLGGNSYAVVVGTFTPPGPPGAANSGGINAFVTVTSLNGGGGIASVPEPGALTLACLAFPLVGLCSWRKRRTYEPEA
jgi:hypothetical protein